MSKGFFYKKGTDVRIPYWVEKGQAERFVTKKDPNGTIEGFSMALPGYGIMHPVTWEYREGNVSGRDQWQTEAP